MKRSFIIITLICVLILSACIAQIVPTSAIASELSIENTPSPRPTATATPIPWQRYKMTISLRIGRINKLWMPVPRNWDGIGMANVEILNISRKPDDLYNDEQGNLIAFWNVANRATAEYSMTFLIDLAPIAYKIDPNLIEHYDISTWEYQRYTQPSKMIQSTDERIIQLAHQIVEKETNPYHQARLIHNWVSRNIKSGRVHDAITTLELREGDCGSHSHLYIALLRSVGIPARNVTGWTSGYKGYFSSGEARGGHAESATLGHHGWTEFYLPKYGWIQSDTSAGPQNFSGINEPRIILSRGEDIKLEHGYPLITVPWFQSPQSNVMTESDPPTQTWGEILKLTVERVS